MSAIISAISDLVDSVPGWVTSFLSLMTTTVATREGGSTTTISFIGLCCLVVPLVGLGIGIIKRLVSVRA